MATAATMLMLFGTIHIVQAQALAELIPNWIPLRHHIPYLTSTLMVAAALAFGSIRTRRQAARIIALMFLSWLPLVHLERLMRHPASFEEWRFALTALALAGALLLISAGVPISSGSTRQTGKGPPPR